MHRPNEATPLSMDKNKLMFPFFFFPIKACMLSPLYKLIYPTPQTREGEAS
jgi:hypothetical protein